MASCHVSEVTLIFSTEGITSGGVSENYHLLKIIVLHFYVPYSIWFSQGLDLWIKLIYGETTTSTSISSLRCNRFLLFPQRCDFFKLKPWVGRKSSFRGAIYIINCNRPYHTGQVFTHYAK